MGLSNFQKYKIKICVFLASKCVFICYGTNRKIYTITMQILFLSPSPPPLSLSWGGVCVCPCVCLCVSVHVFL